MPRIDKDTIATLAQVYEANMHGAGVQYNEEVRRAWHRCLGVDVEDFAKLSPTGFCVAYEWLEHHRPLGAHEMPEQVECNYTDNVHDPDAFVAAREVALRKARDAELPAGVDASTARMMAQEYSVVCDRFHRLLWALTEHDLLQHVGAMQVARTQLVDDPQRILPTQRPTSFELSTGASGQKAAVAREFLGMHERPRRRTMPTMRKLIGEMVAAEEAIAARL